MPRKKKEAPGLVERLKDEIRQDGRTLYQLAKESGVPAPQLSRFMRGERTLTLPTAEKVCRVLSLELVRKKPTGRRKALHEGSPPASGREEG
jgi:transcriptional regulator with XRE-family HTH domain